MGLAGGDVGAAVSRRVPEWLRPVDGWRRFAGEVGVIVLGVLIALVVQQVAQAVKDRSDAASARRAVRYEIGDLLAGLDKRAGTQACIDRRLAEIGALLVRRPFVAPRWIGRPQTWQMSHARLDAATQAGRTTLFPLDEQTEFADIYGSFHAVEDAQQREQAAWAMLRGLEELPTLSDADAAGFRAALQDARFVNWYIRLSYLQADERALALAIPRQPGGSPGSQSVCVPSDTGRAEALRRTNNRYGEP